jgi:hypothetical protein
MTVAERNHVNQKMYCRTQRARAGDRARVALFAFVVSTGVAFAQAPATVSPSAELGVTPPPTATPRVEFAFEFRVTLAPAVVVGDTLFGRRQFIGITGGTIAGPKLKGEVMPGGWDYQLITTQGCASLSADYFIRANDGTVIHVLNEGINCPSSGERSFFRPRFEAPKGPHEWLTRSAFFATLELERSEAEAGDKNTPPPLRAIRLKFYQVK